MSGFNSDNTPADWNLGLAWIASLVATLGALFIGEVLGQTPCLLCWYQRIAMFPLALILGAGVYLGDAKSALYGKLLAWPGLIVALWHVGLIYGIAPQSIRPCGLGPSCTDAKMHILTIPIPLLSLSAFSLILILLHTMKGDRR